MSGDIYEALLGTPTSDAAKLAELARKLRGQSNMGLVAQVSGDRILSPIGKQMMDTSNTQAEDYGKRGQQQRGLLEDARVADQTNAQRVAEMRSREASDKDQLGLGYAQLNENAASRREERALRKALAEMKGGGAEDLKIKAAREKGISTIVGRMAKDNLPGLLGAAQAANASFGQYKGRKDIPGIGKVEGSSLIPDFFRTDEATMNRSDLAGLANQVLKLRSGAAVTDPEMKRFLTELAAGGGVSEDVFKKRWPKVLELLQREQDNILATGDSETQAEYFSRYGHDRFVASDPFAEDSTSHTGPPAAVPKGPNSDIYSMSDEELRKLAGGK